MVIGERNGLLHKPEIAVGAAGTVVVVTVAVTVVADSSVELKPSSYRHTHRGGVRDEGERDEYPGTCFFQ